MNSAGSSRADEEFPLLSLLECFFTVPPFHLSPSPRDPSLSSPSFSLRFSLLTSLFNKQTPQTCLPHWDEGIDIVFTCHRSRNQKVRSAGTASTSLLHFSFFRRRFDEPPPPLSSHRREEKYATIPAPWNGRTEEVGFSRVTANERETVKIWELLGP